MGTDRLYRLYLTCCTTQPINKVGDYLVNILELITAQLFPSGASGDQSIAKIIRWQNTEPLININVVSCLPDV